MEDVELGARQYNPRFFPVFRIEPCCKDRVIRGIGELVCEDWLNSPGVLLIILIDETLSLQNLRDVIHQKLRI